MGNKCNKNKDRYEIKKYSDNPNTSIQTVIEHKVYSSDGTLIKDYFAKKVPEPEPKKESVNIKQLPDHWAVNTQYLNNMMRSIEFNTIGFIDIDEPSAPNICLETIDVLQERQQLQDELTQLRLPQLNRRDTWD